MEQGHKTTADNLALGKFIYLFIFYPIMYKVHVDNHEQRHNMLLCIQQENCAELCYGPVCIYYCVASQHQKCSFNESFKCLNLQMSKLCHEHEQCVHGEYFKTISLKKKWLWFALYIHACGEHTILSRAAIFHLLLKRSCYTFQCQIFRHRLCYTLEM